MRARLSLSFLLVMSLLLAGAPARATRPPLGHYIVVLNDSVSDPASVARQHALAYGAQVRFVYRFALTPDRRRPDPGRCQQHQVR